MSKSKFDLSQINLTKNHLVKPAEEIIKTKSLSENKSKKKEKIGRPIKGTEPLNKKVTVNLSESEIGKIEKKAGGVPISSYIRNVLKDTSTI